MGEITDSGFNIPPGTPVAKLMVDTIRCWNCGHHVEVRGISELGTFTPIEEEPTNCPECSWELGKEDDD